MAERDIELCFVDRVPDEYHCPVCGQVLRYPVQLDQCGHHVCSSCLTELARESPRCPVDGVRVDRDKVYVDKPLQRAIQSLTVKCPFNEKGCEWRDGLLTVSGHVAECDHAPVQCPLQCGVTVERRFVEEHEREECGRVVLSCRYCLADTSRDQLTEHWTVCPSFPVHCPNQCGTQNIQRAQLEGHMKDQCPVAGTACPFGQFGCQYKGDRASLEGHVGQSVARHLAMLCDGALALKDLLRDVRLDEGRLERISRRTDCLEKLYGPQAIWKIDNFRDKLEQAESGARPVLFSPPFLTGRHGYKMALSVCLFGDGEARGGYVSVYICICRGEYDALLNWPFGHRVVFTLLDQCQDPAARRDIVYTLKPNTCKENRPFLDRPRGDRNASFGASKFCQLGALEKLDYVREDTVFIKVRVSTEDMTPL